MGFYTRLPSPWPQSGWEDSLGGSEKKSESLKRQMGCTQVSGCVGAVSEGAAASQPLPQQIVAVGMTEP